MLRMLFYALLLILIVSFSCMRRPDATQKSASKPTVMAEEGAQSVWCWFVEDNGNGERGYAVIDGRLSYSEPDGGGLFSTIEELRRAMDRKKIKPRWVIPTFGGKIPQGWKIRDLTDDEIRLVRPGARIFLPWKGEVK